jgi:hypothetical protein
MPADTRVPNRPAKETVSGPQSASSQSSPRIPVPTNQMVKADDLQVQAQLTGQRQEVAQESDSSNYSVQAASGGECGLLVFVKNTDTDQNPRKLPSYCICLPKSACNRLESKQPTSGYTTKPTSITGILECTSLTCYVSPRSRSYPTTDRRDAIRNAQLSVPSGHASLATSNTLNVFRAHRRYASGIPIPRDVSTRSARSPSGLQFRAAVQ